MTTTENADPGQVPPACPGPAAEALTALLDATTNVERLKRYADLLDRLTVRTVAVWDGHCTHPDGTGRVTPLGTFFRNCLRDSNCRDDHTPDNCRWARAEDQPYPRYPLVTDSWRTEET